VPQYIAATMIAKTPEEYGFNNLVYREPLQYDEVTVDSPLDIDVIAKCAGCTVREIREMNPELRRWSTPPNVPDYIVRIPVGSRDAFLKNLASIPGEERFTIDLYTLKKGDSIKKIARKRGIPCSSIIAMNSLSGLEHLRAGNMITLPPKGKFCLDSDDRASLIQKVSYKKTLSGRHSCKKRRRCSLRRAARAKGRGRIKTRRT
jgi:membrane-bound lytic murein transglycosylase D